MFNLRNQVYKLFFIILTMTCITSCAMVTYDDSSHDPKYSWIVGKKFKIKKAVYAGGITDDINYKRPATRISVKPYGVGGPEVVFKTTVSKNTVFTIKKVLTYRFLLDGDSVKYIVDIESLRHYNMPVGITTFEDISDGNIGLPVDVYEEITNDP